MRILVVARWAPWPARSGAQLRSANMITALASLGEVDVFLHVDPRHETELHVPPGLAVHAVGGATRSDRPPSRVDRAVTLVSGTTPSRIALPRARPEAVRHLDLDAVRRAFAALGPSRYDVAWFVRIESWLALGDLVDAPAVVDYDDLRDRPVGPRLPDRWPAAPGRDSPPARGAVGSAARMAVRTRHRRADAAAWARMQRRVAAEVAAVVVCSELDATRLAVPNGRVVPNGVDLPDTPVGRPQVGHSPTILFHGSLAYEPNVDAATVLVHEVLPRVRARIRDAVVRLAGRGDERVARLAAIDGVTVTGPVDDMATELVRADVVAVPLREGAGTRIKVLEALAHRIPVVATSVAVEGLAVEPGRHLLVADDPDAFAAACVTLLRDEPRRRALAEAGARLVGERYRWDQARAAAVQTVAEVVDVRAPSRRPSAAARPPTPA